MVTHLSWRLSWRLSRSLSCWLLAALAGGMGVAHAVVTAEVDRNPVRVGETFELTVRAQGRGGISSPDFDQLDPPLRVLGTTTGTQYQLLNGRATETRTWTVTLAARRPGQVTIPALSVGSETTNPIVLDVVRPSTDPDTPPDAFIEFDVDKRSAYVREQVAMTVRLYFRGDLMSGNLSEPSAPNAVIEQLGQQAESRETRDGIGYRLVERRYVLFAERSGSLTIEPPVFNGEVGSRGRTVFGFDQFGGQARSIYAGGEPVTLDIQPPPDGHADAWLPATDVRLSDDLLPSGSERTVGEPFTREIQLRVDGQLHTQLVAIDLNIPDALQAYAEPSEGETVAMPEGVQGRQTHRWALIPTQAGTITLPGVSVQWWDVNADRLRTTRLPPREITVAPGAGAPASPPPAATGATAAAAPTPQADARAGPATPPPQHWIALAVFALLGWLGTAAAWGYVTLRKRRAARLNPANATRMANDIRTARRTLDTAIDRGDAAAVRDALLDWARLRWGPGPVPPRIDTLAQRLDNPELASALHALDAALYAGDAQWSPARVRDAVNALDTALDAMVPSSTAARPVQSLQPLYPT